MSCFNSKSENEASHFLFAAIFIHKKRISFGKTSLSKGCGQSGCGLLLGRRSSTKVGVAYYLRELMVVNKIWSMSVDESTESQTILPAKMGKPQNVLIILQYLDYTLISSINIMYFVISLSILIFKSRTYKSTS